MCISKWGNSLAVRLPLSLVKELGLHEGEEVEVAVKKKTLAEDGFDAAIVTPQNAKTRRRAADSTSSTARRSRQNLGILGNYYIRKIREEMPLLPADFKFDREEANARR